ncbi:di-trans,poly-cis-decaprenylcistransferase [Endozoicomonas sp. (ex Bugula neritina AB1)]|nr:di-trans,poly-cis-decaprenylcistransferase [Endozoicomonas sp. (ex Bugula neritina AB1)]
MANKSIRENDSVLGVPSDRLPRHVAIILDGNNRWAKLRHLPGLAGHKAGVDRVREIVEASGEFGVQVLTLFAFSSENWNRPQKEVNGLMRLFLRALRRETKKLQRNRIRLKIIGDLSRFSPVIQKHIHEAEKLTACDARVTLIIAANYGGKWDIAQATQKIAKKVAAGDIMPEQVNDDLIEQYLSTAGFPAPDLMIRTSGEQRISNFLLWQCAYSEYYFTNTLWPDFGREAFQRALQAYVNRQRRFGRTSEQVEAEVTC